MRAWMIAVSLVFLAHSVNAGKERREHKAHAHGFGEMTLAFEGTKGELEFKVPGESVFGFEHKPKNEGEQKKVDQALENIEKKITKAVSFDKDLDCNLTKASFSVEAEKHSCACGKECDGKSCKHNDHAKGDKKSEGCNCGHDKNHHKKHMDHGEHMDVEGRFEITCAKDPTGKKLTVNPKEIFPKIEILKFTFLVGETQKSIEMKKKTEVVLQ